MFNEKKVANTLGGTTARACDGCLRKRAHWFCPSDDAFLCQFCDTSVHSANQLASRHSRVRLETASSNPVTGWTKIEPWSPLWYQGFTRKARSPRSRNGKNTLLAKSKVLNSLPLVPEIGSEEEGNMAVDDSEDQLPFRVPVFDPFTEDINDILTREELERDNENKLDDFLELQLPSDIHLGEYENMLRSEFDDVEEPHHVKSSEKELKIKDEAIMDCNGNFCLDLPVVDVGVDEQEQEERVVPVSGFVGLMMDDESKHEMKKKMFLRLNYEAVINAWGGQGSPCDIRNGSQFSDCHISGYLEGANPKDFHPPIGGASGQPGGSDGGREARVLRYKEKRRTLLFSKKIRYEVRKLNAERRPRMKGRFVKRTSFAGNCFPCDNYNK